MSKTRKPQRALPKSSKKITVRDATTDPAIITEWWTRWPDAMIGIPMGAANGMFCVNLNRKHGVDGVANWAKLAAENGGCPKTRTHATPNYGLNLLFRHRDGIRNIPLGRLGPGISVIGEGGHIIAPPSRTESGRAYRVVSDCEIAEAPQWLINMVRKVRP